MPIGGGTIAAVVAIVIVAVESEMLIDFIVRRLRLYQCRVGDVGGIEVCLPIGTAAAVGAGREWSKYIRTIRLRVVCRVERVTVVRVEKLAGRSLRHGLIRVHHETALAVVLMLKLLTLTLTMVVAMLGRM